MKINEIISDSGDTTRDILVNERLSRQILSTYNAFARTFNNFKTPPRINQRLRLSLLHDLLLDHHTAVNTFGQDSDMVRRIDEMIEFFTDN